LLCPVAIAQRNLQTQRAILNKLNPGGQFGHSKFRSSAGRGGRTIGGQVTYGGVNFMPNGGNDRQARLRKSSNNALFAESQQVFEGTPTSSGDNYVLVILRIVQKINGSNDRRGRFATLHNARRHQYVDAGKAPSCHLDDVPNGGPRLGRG